MTKSQINRLLTPQYILGSWLYPKKKDAGGNQYFVFFFLVLIKEIRLHVEFKISLLHPRGVTFLLNSTASGQKSMGAGRR